MNAAPAASHATQPQASAAKGAAAKGAAAVGSAVVAFDAASWNECGEEPVESTPLELRGAPDVFESAASLIDALLFGGLPGLCLIDIRRVAQTSKGMARMMDDNEVWRLASAACATQFGLYAPASSPHWKRFFLETLWPARSKWRGAEATEAVGFRIRVAVRVRPRKQDASRHDGLVLPLHQRLRMLKKGEKLGSLDAERGGSTQEALCEALKDQVRCFGGRLMSPVTSPSLPTPPTVIACLVHG